MENKLLRSQSRKHSSSEEPQRVTSELRSDTWGRAKFSIFSFRLLFCRNRLLTESRHQGPDHQSRDFSQHQEQHRVTQIKSFCLQNVICKHNTNSSKILRSSALYLGCRSYLAKCALSQVSLAAATPSPSPPHNLVLDAFFIAARLGPDTLGFNPGTGERLGEKKREEKVEL